jgi:CBS domain-containing protein
LSATVRRMPASSRVGRFLDTFRLIEAHVRVLAAAGADVPFGIALKSACERSPELRCYEAELRQFAKLRNAIVHEPYEDGEAIADPRESAILQMDAIARAIIKPPTALSVLKHPVTIATPHMPLKAAAILMMDGHFSQLPVVDHGEVLDVLTSGALAGYFTDANYRSGSVSDSAEVIEVVGFDEDREIVSRPRNMTVLAVVDEFEKREQAGRLLNAICLVEERKVLGIATVFDLPALIKAGRPYQPNGR